VDRTPPRAPRTLLRLALAVVLAALPSWAWGQCLSVASFARDTVGGFPAGWRVSKSEGYEVYRVQEEEGVRFLRGLSRGVAAQAVLEHSWDLSEYPIFSWRWRPRVFPEGSDERSGRTNDSALGVYVGFPRSLGTVKSVKYVWSRAAPVGATASASAGFTRMLVLRSGPVEAGRWIEERVNVRDDYHRLFGDEAGKPRGIGVLTDADDTRSVAEGDYADFRVCRP